MINDPKDAKASNEHKDAKASNEANTTKLNAKFKETWSKLSDADIALYATKRDQFVGKLKELYSLSKEDADKKISALETQCGCGASMATKAA